MTIRIPVSTVQKPLTAIDFIGELTAQCRTLNDIAEFASGVPMEVRQDDRFARAVANKLAAVHEKKAAA